MVEKSRVGVDKRLYLIWWEYIGSSVAFLKGSRSSDLTLE